MYSIHLEINNKVVNVKTKYFLLSSILKLASVLGSETITGSRDQQQFRSEKNLTLNTTVQFFLNKS